MPDIGGFASSLSTSLGGPLTIVAGVLLLLFGRRLYWLFAGVVGFTFVFLMARRLAPELSEQTVLLVSLVAGAIGAAITVFAHKLLLRLVGALGGALIALWQVQNLGIESGPMWLAAAIAGGLVGGWLVGRLFEFALALLSSLFGAQLLLDSVGVEPAWTVPAYIGLVVFGLFFQLIRSRRRKGRKSRKE